MKKATIIFALGNCLADDVGLLVNFLKKHGSKSSKLTRSGFSKLPLLNNIAGKKVKEKALRFIQKPRLRYAAMQPVKNAVSTILGLAEMGYDVRVCTWNGSLSGNSLKSLKSVKRRWVNKHISRDIGKSIVYLPSSEKIEADLLVCANIKHKTSIEFKDWVIVDKPFNNPYKPDPALPAPAARIDSQWNNFFNILQTLGY